MSQNYCVYFNINGLYTFYFPHDQTFGTTTDITTLPQQRFEVFKDYRASMKGLIRFADDFQKWCNELNNNACNCIDYAKYFGHGAAAVLVFKMFSNGLYEHFEIIDYLESWWIEKCHNGGLSYLKNAGIHTCYAKDMKGFYPHILASDMLIPTKQGKEKTIKKLPKKLSHGMYHCKISCDNPEFRKLFAFSKDNVYMHYSINHARKYQNEFNVKIDLILDDEPNCYLYDDKDLIKVRDIFAKHSAKGYKNWFDTLNLLKTMYPENKLIKNLFTNLHGHLIAWNKISRTYDEIAKEGLKVDAELCEDTQYIMHSHHIINDVDYYDLIDVDKPYRYNIRLKSWLTAFGRNKIADKLYPNIANVIRIQTDGIIFDKPIEDDDELFVDEEKNCGTYNWVNVNNSDKIQERLNNLKD